ncbi:tetratricopeptide repeat protein [Kitasatospora sp. NPDC005856]|uniref:tetratricopeptide repeat protein n=1 Tax=Kitasatospora sp. NPDC005856 TaxID=3154566 RepID=UPI00340644A5
MIPPRALSFQQRAEADHLRAAVDAGGTAVLSQVLAGAGGVGKTQLAADYARTAWENGSVDVLVWVSASSRQAITAGYAQAGIELLAADPDDPEQAARAFLAWLEPKPEEKPCRWLVVLDDLADPADLRGLWPPNQHGRTLVTTRRREAALTGQGRRLVHVGMFMPWEAGAYLTAVLTAHDCTEPADEINALAEDLGCLPLALAQAAAYIVDAGTTCAAYRSLLADRRRKLADLLPESNALPDDQAATVAAAWSLSIEHADRIRPQGLARPMLQLTAMLDPSGIPDTVLISPPALSHLTRQRTLTTPIPDGPVRAEDATAALRVLHRLNLVDHTPDTPHQAVRVHQLIQRAALDALTPTQRREFARTAADALDAVWPEEEPTATFTLTQALRANTEALISAADHALYRPSVHVVLYRFGRSLGGSGQAAAARDYFQNLVDQTARRRGPDHIDTLAARYNLARWLGEAGDAAGASSALTELLEDWERVVGSDTHFLAPTIRSEIARWQGVAGETVGAASALAGLAEDRRRVLGPDHPDTLNTRHDYANSLGEAGDPAGAAAALAGLAEDRKRVLGPDHPDTLNTRHDLARWQAEAGNVAGAVAAYVKLVEDRERVLGPDHIDTLAARGNLAHWRAEAGDAAGAVAAYLKLVDDVLRVLGPDHPHTLAARGNLAHWRGVAGDAAGAAAALAGLVEDRERVLDPDHPHTLTARQELARWQAIAGDMAGAIVTNAALLEDEVRVLGPDHPETLATRANLALLQGMTGDIAAAVTAYDELLDDMARVLGPDHPDTLAVERNLNYWLNGLEG